MSPGFIALREVGFCERVARAMEEDGGRGGGFSGRIRRGYEEAVAMSSKESTSWVERWWLALLILFGLLFVTFLVSFKPRI